MSVAADIAKYVATRHVVGEGLRDLISTAFIDCAAVTVAARHDPLVQIVGRKSALNEGDSNVLFNGNKRTNSECAAFINAVAAHALDYDDVALASHTSAILVPALLAEGEALCSSGRALIDAYFVGYEVWAALGKLVNVHLHDRGWHPTAVLGVVAGAAAVSHLRAFDERAAHAAVSVAASTAAGLTGAFGSMIKPMQIGKAAANAVWAANIAGAGVSVPQDIFDGTGGFLSAFSGRPAAIGAPPRAATFDASEPELAREGIEFKKYPVCFAAHRAIDAAMRIEVDDPKRIMSIDVELPATHARLLRYAAPATVLEAKFSVNFAIAAAFLVRRVGFSELTESFVRAHETAEIMKKVRVHVRHDENVDMKRGARVAVRLSDGATLDSGVVETPDRLKDMSAKFADCYRFAGREPDLALWIQLQRLGDVSNVRDLLSR